jgi:hypothetical protein
MSQSTRTQELKKADHFFSVDYKSAREKFMAKSLERGGELSSYRNGEAPDPSAIGLYADMAVFGEADGANVLIISSGTHGVEGYAGSACQLHMLDRNFYGCQAASHTKLILVHALNPYGFAYDRRVTENNVDLNRNFIDFSVVERPLNDGYVGLHPYLVPAESNSGEHAEADYQIARYVRENGIDALKSSVMAGQYQIPTGLFFGGTEPVWSRRFLERLIEVHASCADRVFFLDLHTGLGSFGAGEVLYPLPTSHPSYSVLKEQYGQDLRCLFANESVSGVVSGSIGNAFDRMLNGKVHPIALEFGTVALSDMLNALRFDAQIYARREASDLKIRHCRHVMRSAFVSDDPIWRRNVLLRFQTVTERLITLL